VQHGQVSAARRAGVWALVAVLAVAMFALVQPASSAGASSEPVTDEPSTPPTVDEPSTTINEFIPTDRDLTDCLSALPRPGCGSEARGGWHQAAVFAVMVVGLGVIGTRVVIGLRRRPD